jgi:hypothetical protein
VPEVQTQHPPNSEPIIRSDLTQITPQSRRSPIPSPHTQPEHTDQARHIPIIETPKPRRDASDLIRDATVPVKTDQTWYHPTSNPTPKTRRDASDLIRNATAPEKTDQTRHTSETLKPRKDASDFIRDASAPVKTDQTWSPPTSNPTPITRRDVSDLIRNASQRL